MPSRTAEQKPPSSVPVASVIQYVRVARLVALRGCLPGLRQPAALADFQLMTPAPKEVVQVCTRIAEHALSELPTLPAFPEFGRRPDLEFVVRAAWALLQEARWPLLDPLAIVRRRTPAEDRVRVAFPSLHDRTQGIHLALGAAVKLLHDVAAQSTEENAAVADLKAQVKAVRAFAPSGMNTLNFLEASHAQGIPWARVAHNVYQYGWGAKGRWLNSSFTDQTPVIAATIARDKRLASIVLHRAGLPVPEHLNVTTLEEALEAAKQLGYPVVVKPADLDGGLGVFTFLESSAAVRDAFTAASRFSPNLIVQQHIMGNDYRLQVFQGEVFWATHRKPAGVTGDGTHSVRDLVKQINADPRRGPADSPGLKWIILDDESDAWLARQKLDLDTVPEEGRVVRLRGAANVTMGGTIEPVLEITHPDNVALAARAARVLRLDLAGVDLLIADIRRSWREIGAAICEVNAQPEMSPHLPAQLLRQLVAGQGRIPVVMVIGGDVRASHCKAFFEAFARLGKGVGIGTTHASVSGVQVSKGALDSFDVAQCLLSDPAVRAIALHVEDIGLMHSGLPFDRIDHLVLTGPILHQDKPDWPRTFALVNWIKRASVKLWLLDDSPQWLQAPARQLVAQSARASVDVVLEHVRRAFTDGEQE
jgi:cyanophycin synthetase